MTQDREPTGQTIRAALATATRQPQLGAPQYGPVR
jgi:hypothetical protein